jgi:hypothetical protein
MTVPEMWDALRFPGNKIPPELLDSLISSGLTKTFVAKINPSSIICFLFLFETKVQNYLEKSKRLLTFAE